MRVRASRSVGKERSARPVRTNPTRKGPEAKTLDTETPFATSHSGVECCRLQRSGHIKDKRIRPLGRTDVVAGAPHTICYVPLPEGRR